MDAYYFPIFLVFMAALVIWFYFKSSRASERREDARYRRMQARQAAAARTRAASAKPTRNPRSASAGQTTPDKVWSSRRQRAKKKMASPQASHANSKTFQASYLGPYERAQAGEPGAGSVQDQEVSRLDYVGFDEYITRERLKAGEKESSAADEFSMTAVKYDSQEEEQEESGSSKKRAGFKP